MKSNKEKRCSRNAFLFVKLGFIGVFARTNAPKVLVLLFQKRAGFGAAPHKIGISLLLAFLFVPLMAKRKAAKEF